MNNIGDSDIELPYQTQANEIVFKFENSSTEYKSYENLIAEKLAKMNIILASGAVKSDIVLKLPIQKKEIYKPSLDTFIKKDSLTFNSLDTNKHTLNCADLVIDSIKIIKKKGKSAIFNITIQNIGQKEIKLWGVESTYQDNLAIKAFLSSYNHISNSSIFLRGLYIQDEANEIGGILNPNQKIRLVMELNLKQKTKFTPYILFEINALRSELECSFENNTNFMHLD